jgi:hypothetical protein
MGRCRSYCGRLQQGLPLDAKQQKRFLRDQYYRVQDAGTFVTKLEPHLHSAGKRILHGLSVHQGLSDSSQSSSPSGKRVAHAAFKSGAISRPQLQAARSFLTSADEAKHSVVARVSAWADVIDSVEDDAFSICGDAAHRCTYEVVKEEVVAKVANGGGIQDPDVPAPKRDGAAGFSVLAPEFAPAPAVGWDHQLLSDFAIPSIGEQLDYLLSCHLQQHQVPERSDSVLVDLREENALLKEEVAQLRKGLDVLSGKVAAEVQGIRDGYENEIKESEQSVAAQVVSFVIGRLPQLIVPVVEQSLTASLEASLGSLRQSLIDSALAQCKYELLKLPPVATASSYCEPDAEVLVSDPVRGVQCGDPVPGPLSSMGGRASSVCDTCYVQYCADGHSAEVLVSDPALGEQCGDPVPGPLSSAGGRAPDENDIEELLGDAGEGESVEIKGEERKGGGEEASEGESAEREGGEGTDCGGEAGEGEGAEREGCEGKGGGGEACEGVGSAILVLGLGKLDKSIHDPSCSEFFLMAQSARANFPLISQVVVPPLMILDKVVPLHVPGAAQCGTRLKMASMFGGAKLAEFSNPYFGLSQWQLDKFLDDVYGPIPSGVHVQPVLAELEPGCGLRVSSARGHDTVYNT